MRLAATMRSPAAEPRLEIAGVAPRKSTFAGNRVESQPGEAALAVEHQLALVLQGVAQRPWLRELDPGVDEARGKVDAGDVIETPRQLETRAPRGAAQIQRTSAGAPAWRSNAAIAFSAIARGKFGTRSIPSRSGTRRTDNSASLS